MNLVPVPPLEDHRLEFFLNQLRTSLHTLDKKVNPESTPGEEQEDISGGTFEPVAVAAAVLASDGLGSTENAFTSVSAGAPTGARFARIRFVVNSTDNADDGDLRYMGAEGIDSGIIVECIAGVDDARDTAIDWVKLDDSGSLQYKFTNTSATTIEWSVTYTGYSL